MAVRESISSTTDSQVGQFLVGADILKVSFTGDCRPLASIRNSVKLLIPSSVRSSRLDVARIAFPALAVMMKLSVERTAPVFANGLSHRQTVPLIDAQCTFLSLRQLYVATKYHIIGTYGTYDAYQH